MDQWLSNPPFLHHCLLCKTDKIRIWHPDWPEDPKQLEKAWQSKEARKREMADVREIIIVCISSMILTLPVTRILSCRIMVGGGLYGHVIARSR